MPAEKLVKFSYFSDMDTLYIDLADRSSVDSDEVSPDIVLDMDADNNIVGIEIEHASSHADLDTLSFSVSPFLPTKTA